jgi:hypothetical protein
VSGPFTIPNDAWFDDGALCRMLGLRVGSLDRARRSGELRHTRRGGRTLYKGAWVDEWLARGASPRDREATPCNPA